MKERPILFRGELVREILAGRKTVTRRPVKPQPRWEEEPAICDDGKWRGRYQHLCGNPENPDVGVEVDEARCPYGAPGDRLWVRESHSLLERDTYGIGLPGAWYWADGNPEHGDWTRPRPSIHMPRWASRLTLSVDAVRVERLSAVTDEDARAEGVGTRADFMEKWDLLYGGTPFFSQFDPWVWVVSFHREAA